MGNITLFRDIKTDAAKRLARAMNGVAVAEEACLAAGEVAVEAALKSKAATQAALAAQEAFTFLVEDLDKVTAQAVAEAAESMRSLIDVADAAAAYADVTAQAVTAAYKDRAIKERVLEQAQLQYNFDVHLITKGEFKWA